VHRLGKAELRILHTLDSALLSIHVLAGPCKPRGVRALETKTCVFIDYLRNITEYSDFGLNVTPDLTVLLKHVDG
jgi:hypothetical protein